jgi:hypothetical protein
VHDRRRCNVPIENTSANAAVYSLGERLPGNRPALRADLGGSSRIDLGNREALEERTRERVPLDWAMTQNNLGNALLTLGERESGTGKLMEAVAAYREALRR